MKFRKKPVVIEAMQYTGKTGDTGALADWMGHTKERIEKDGSSKLLIETLEGTMAANPGDWVIKGAKGEFYPCKPDIFEATYEPVLEQEIVLNPIDSLEYRHVRFADRRYRRVTSGCYACPLWTDAMSCRLRGWFLEWFRACAAVSIYECRSPRGFI